MGVGGEREGDGVVSEYVSSLETFLTIKLHLWNVHSLKISHWWYNLFPLKRVIRKGMLVVMVQWWVAGYGSVMAVIGEKRVNVTVIVILQWQLWGIVWYVSTYTLFNQKFICLYMYFLFKIYFKKMRPINFNLYTKRIFCMKKKHQ